MICAYCQRATARAGVEVMVVTLQGASGEKIELRWHLADTSALASRLGRPAPNCAAIDPLHQELADAIGLPDGPESDDVARAVYMKIRARAASFGQDMLRDVVMIPRDVCSTKWTLRGPGLGWGVLTKRRPAGRRARA